MYIKNQISVILFTLFVTCFVNAQTTDLLRLEYLHVPNSNTKNDYSRYRILFQAPLKLSEGNYLIIGGDYRYMNLTLEDVPFDTTDLNSVQSVEGSIGYLRRLKESDWSFAGKVGLRITSNFDGKLVADDYVYLIHAYGIRDRTKEGRADKPNRLIIGLDYSTTPTRNFPLPVINYYREFAPDWTYTLGVPKTNLRYKFDDKHHVQAYLTLDNFFANIQGNKVVNGRLAENISATVILGGLGYEYYFTKHLLYYGYVAYSIFNDYRLRNNEREDIYTIDDKATAYFRTGLKFKY